MKKIITHTYFLAIIACLLWSTAFAGIKIGLQYTTPLQFAGIRFFFAGLFIIPLTKNLRVFVSAMRSDFWLIARVSLFQTIILYSLFYLGVSLVPGAIAAILIGSQPLFAALVSSVMQKNDQLSFKKLLAISLGIGGIALIAYDKGWGDESGLQQMMGMGILILANISSGIGNVFVSKQKGKISPTVLSAWQMSMGGLVLFLISLIFEPFSGFDMPVAYFLSLGWLSFLSATAFTIWFTLLQRSEVRVSDLNIWKFIIPIFGAMLSWIIIPNEHAELIPILGMIIIGFSLVLYGLVNRKVS
ncbi:DMT family transporter [Saccharicrinis fermentans]|uniref:Putative amino-acid metabolite efflux pump n=1 Tax=Saccharicrinis fermentans DSM 9555 = JCM 21142 TaxID=869213 RepID=W7Y4J2_9BACT|nr:DMT family transporter [Saccharicrinis fermentans]GAF02503.1 putative amino-acid metabolite efflux pump [Saccharicrinis fermentans DSM 9555 = JCM 21142]